VPQTKKLQQLELQSTRRVLFSGKSGSCLRSSASSRLFTPSRMENFLIRLSCEAILFDMDGTLVDSTACVEAIWERWARKHGVDLTTLLQLSHGRRTVDTIKDIAPHLNAESEAEALESMGSGDLGEQILSGSKTRMRGPSRSAAPD
jgi:hypothetical protein